MIKYRNYQENVVDKGVDFFNIKEPKPSLIVSPVGSGKSIMIGGIAKELIEPTLILQPSKELLEQNYQKFIDFGGQASIFSASVGIKEIGHTTYATLGSIKNKAKEFKKLGVRNVIIDEAHLGYPPEEGTMFRNFMDELNPKYSLGFTATPVRLKQYGDMNHSWSQLNMLTRTNPKYFKEFLEVVPISLMVNENYWSELLYEEYDFDESKLRLNSSGAEFTEHSIKQAVSEQGVNNNIYLRVKSLLNDGKRKSILVFTDSVYTAEKLSEKFSDSAVISGSTKTTERTKIIKDFKKGKIKVIFNFGVLTVGFDHPALDCIILGRPTNSLAFYYQMCGRGVRLFDLKDNCLIIDFCNNTKRFGKIEDLEIQFIEGYGWGIFNKHYLLSGIPMGSKVTIDDIKKKEVKKSQDAVDYIFDFGKYRGRKLSETPLYYRNWVLSNIDNLNFKGISKESLKTQLLNLIETEASVQFNENELIVVDFNNITHILNKDRKLNSVGFKTYLDSLCRLYNTSNIKVVTDCKKPYWRTQIYSQYKATRKKQDLDEKFIKGLNDIYKNHDLINEEGMEADDLISNFVRDTKYLKTYIVSSDSDFGQLALFNRFFQHNPRSRKIITYSKKEAIGILVTKILKGDAKDNILKCHNENRIMTKDLDNLIDTIYNDVVRFVKDNNIKNIEEVNFKDIFWSNLSKKYNIDKEKFELNFKLLNLIQQQFKKE